MRELTDLGVWNEELKNSIIANRGSIQHIDGISDHIKNKYKIVWEIPMKVLIDMAADRGAFIDQSQSLNLWMEEPNYKSLTSMHFYSHKKGLKTGIYYLRRKPRHQPQQFTIDVNKNTEDNEPEECLMWARKLYSFSIIKNMYRSSFNTPLKQKQINLLFFLSSLYISLV